jgi:hypothetical protein
MWGLGKLRHEAIGRASAATEACLATIGVPRPGALLLLGHMRSGSSLLLHLLLTNSQVAAMGERNAVYASRSDLSHLAVATRVAARSPLRRLRYIADQVNHNHLTPNSAVLQDPRVRVLFLLRRPQPTLASILWLYRTYYPQPRPVARAVDYYVERLGFLSQLGERLRTPVHAALILYETLTESAPQSLQALRRFLELPQGFSQTYRTYSFTSTRGDPGPNIRTGQIVRAAPSAPIDLSASDLERVTDAYARCRNALARFALSG